MNIKNSLHDTLKRAINVVTPVQLKSKELLRFPDFGMSDLTPTAYQDPIGQIWFGEVDPHSTIARKRPVSKVKTSRPRKGKKVVKLSDLH